MGGPKIFQSLQTVPWSEELWFEEGCLVSVDLSFQRDWGLIEERYGIGKDCWAQRGVSQVQQWAVLNLGPVTFALFPCPYLCLCLYVDCWILPNTGRVDCVLDYILAGGTIASADGYPCLLQFFLLLPWIKSKSVQLSYVRHGKIATTTKVVASGK